MDGCAIGPISLWLSSSVIGSLEEVDGFGAFNSAHRSGVGVHFDARCRRTDIEKDFPPEGEFYCSESSALGCISFYSSGRYHLMRVDAHTGHPLVCIISCEGISGFRVQSNWDEIRDPALLKFALWISFNVAALAQSAVAIHASSIVHRGEAVLCLGESGTGKSTHTSLWREVFDDCTLLNDDSPIMYLREGRVMASGSPWSGKTPCYRNESFPLRAIVRIVRAPFNRIMRIQGLDAFAALFPSCPPEFDLDAELTDRVCAILDFVIRTIPVYTLECLPDTDAAILCHNTLYGNKH